MPIHDKKVISVILEECRKIDERFPGYRELLQELLTDILQAEANHRVQATHIHKSIKEMINAAGKSVVDKQTSSGM